MHQWQYLGSSVLVMVIPRWLGPGFIKTQDLFLFQTSSWAKPNGCLAQDSAKARLIIFAKRQEFHLRLNPGFS